MMMAGESFTKSVKRAGADVAEHDADRADDKLGRRLLACVAVSFRLVVLRVRGGARQLISHEGNARWS